MLYLNKLLTIRRLLEVYIGVSQGTPGDHVPTDPDREDCSGWAEFLVQHGLGHILMQISDVQGGHGVTGSTGVHFPVAVEASRIIVRSYMFLKKKFATMSQYLGCPTVASVTSVRGRTWYNRWLVKSVAVFSGKRIYKTEMLKWQNVDFLLA